MVQFRKSKKAGLFRVTASKNGLSFSAGAGPLRVSRGSDGKVRRTVSAPGTGIYDTKVVGGKKKHAANTPSASGPSTINGVGGYLEFDGTSITIRHTGNRGLADVMFPLDVIDTVKFQDAAAGTGYLQFVIGNEPNADTPEADRTTIFFDRSTESGFIEFLQVLS